MQQRLRARGKWRPEYALGLAPTVTQCARYLSFARAIRALQIVEGDELMRMQATLADTHRPAREGLAQYLMIPHDRVPFAVMNSEGLDADIAALCAPFEFGKGPA